MLQFPRPLRITGIVLHVLLGALMIFAASGKLSGNAPPEVMENLRKHGLADVIQLIGIGELLTAILLILPWTSSLGVLLACAFWGGAICIHMAHNESYVFQSVLLVLTCISGGLRNPGTFASFFPTPRAATTATPESSG
jgi:hypothetical protein